MKMVDELHLLHVMVISLKDMMSKILIPSTLQGMPTIQLYFTIVPLIPVLFRPQKEFPFCGGLFEARDEGSLLLAIGVRFE